MGPNVPNAYVLAFAAILVLIGIRIARRGGELRALIARMRALTPTALSDLKPGLVQVRATIQSDEPMAAPLSGRPCVYAFVRANRIPKGGQGPKRLASHKTWTPSYVSDGIGRIELQPWTPLVSATHKDTIRFEQLGGIPEGREDLFELMGMADRHAARIGTFDVTELRVQPGDEMYVTGTYEPGKGIYRHKRNPFIVSATPHIGYTAGLRNEVILYTAVAPMTILAGLILAVLAFA